MNRRGFIGATVLLTAVSRDALTQDGPGPGSSAIERKLVPLLTMSRDEYRFYYRLAGEVVYLPAESVVAYLGEKRYRAWDLVQRIQRELPLQRHTDIFALFLTERVVWRTLRFVLAETLQNGEASVWNLEKGLVSEIEVERYAEGGIYGRRFRYAGGVLFFEVDDGSA